MLSCWLIFVDNNRLAETSQDAVATLLFRLLLVILDREGAIVIEKQESVRKVVVRESQPEEAYYYDDS